MKKVLFILALFITSVSFAQLENNHWSFGYHAGADFSSGTAVASISSIDNNSGGGRGSNAASVSGANGNPQFYTDGITVWDKNNNVMTNGTGLLGSINTPYDKQSLIIVPKPLNDNLYYIFYASITSIPSNISGFYYSVVNMDPNQYGGNGFIDPTLKNIPLRNPAGNDIAFNFSTNTGVQLNSNCMSSTLHKFKDKIWLTFFAGIVESGIVNEYCYEYLISNTGIGTVSDGQSPIPSNNFAVTGPNIPTTPNFPNFNYIKFSPDGSRLSYDNEYGVVAYGFDNEHGTVSIPQPVYMSTTGMSQTGFGLEFSPNNNLLYFSTQDNVLLQGPFSFSGGGIYKKYMRIRQYNFLGGMDSSVIVGEIELPDSISPQSIVTPIPTINRCADLQLGRDGVIYVSLQHNSINIVDHLAGVLLPNNPGATQCGFSNNVMNCAANTYQMGHLPQWVHKAIPPCMLPTVSPTGPVDYYYNRYETHYLTFTTNNPVGNQWFVDGLPIAGQTNQQFIYSNYTPPRTNLDVHYISVRNCNGGFSQPVTVNFILNFSLTSLSNTPSQYCINTSSYANAFNLALGATYSWEFINNGTSTNGSVVSIVNQSPTNPVAQVSVTPTTPGNVTKRIIAKSENNAGIVKILDYGVITEADEHYFGGFYYTSNPNYYDVWIGGRFHYENEHYDFGNAIIITPGYGNLNYVDVPGTGTPVLITLQRNGMTTYALTNTNPSTNGDCHIVNFELHLVNQLTDSISSENTNEPIDISIYPNPATDNIHVDLSRLSTSISQVYIYGAFDSKRLSFGNFKQADINIRHLNKGLYTLIVVTKNGVLTKKFYKL